MEHLSLECRDLYEIWGIQHLPPETRILIKAIFSDILLR